MIHVQLPGVDERRWQDLLKGGTFYNFLGFLSGGALQKLSIIAMGITPYINASIIMQLMTVVLPQLEELAKKGGEEGRKKISQYTRWLTIVLAIVQATTMSVNMSRAGVFNDPLAVVHRLCRRRVRRGHALPDVARRADDGQGHRQRRLADHLHRHRSALPDVRRPDDPGRPERGPQRPRPRVCSSRSRSSRSSRSSSCIRGSAAFPCSKRAASSAAKCSRAARPTFRCASITRASSRSSSRSRSCSCRNKRSPGSSIRRSRHVLQSRTDRHSDEHDGVFARLANVVQPERFLYNFAYFLLVVMFTFFYSAIVVKRQRHRGQPEEERLVHPGHSAGRPTEDYIRRILLRITTVAAVYLGLLAILPSTFQRGLGVTTFYLGSTSLLDRRRRRARYDDADRSAPRDARLQGLHQAMSPGDARVSARAIRVVFLGPPGAGKGTQAKLSRRGSARARSPRATFCARTSRTARRSGSKPSRTWMRANSCRTTSSSA